MRYCRDGKLKDSFNNAGIQLVAASEIFSNQSRWPVLRRKDDSQYVFQCIHLESWMDITRTNSINLDNDFAKDFLQISRKVTLGNLNLY